MKAIIVGNNRVEFCTIPKKDISKCFFEYRSQLY